MTKSKFSELNRGQIDVGQRRIRGPLQRGASQLPANRRYGNQKPTRKPMPQTIFVPSNLHQKKIGLLAKQISWCHLWLMINETCRYKSYELFQNESRLYSFRWSRPLTEVGAEISFDTCRARWILRDQHQYTTIRDVFHGFELQLTTDGGFSGIPGRLLGIGVLVQDLIFRAQVRHKVKMACSSNNKSQEIFFALSWVIWPEQMLVIFWTWTRTPKWHSWKCIKIRLLRYDWARLFWFGLGWFCFELGWGAVAVAGSSGPAGRNGSWWGAVGVPIPIAMCLSFSFRFMDAWRYLRKKRKISMSRSSHSIAHRNDNHQRFRNRYSREFVQRCGRST
jgi:hypothetical protein